jgi:hypothetical protein
MTIGIITSSISDFYLLRILRETNLPFHIRYDQEWGDRGDKEEGYVRQRVEIGMQWLIDAGVTQIVLPPMRELHYRADTTYGQYVMPLFYLYVTMVCLPASRVGKIWLLGEYSDCVQQDLIRTVCTYHMCTQVQSVVSAFHQPMSLRCIQVSMWKHFLTTLWFRDRMMHNVVKHDMHALLDAGVDTVIPLQYGYFAYETTIAKMIRTKKCRLHRSDVLVRVFTECLSLVSSCDSPAHREKNLSETYSITISYTGINAHILAEKKRLRILQRGKTCDIIWQKI